MGNVVEFTPRLATTDPQDVLSTSIIHYQKSLAESFRVLLSSLASVGESLQKFDTHICHIDDAETRERLRCQSEQNHRDWLITSNKLLNAASFFSKGSA